MILDDMTAVGKQNGLHSFELVCECATICSFVFCISMFHIPYSLTVTPPPPPPPLLKLGFLEKREGGGGGITASIAFLTCSSCTIRLRNAVSPRNAQVPHKSSDSIEVFHVTSQSHYVMLVAILEYSSRY